MGNSVYTASLTNIIQATYLIRSHFKKNDFSKQSLRCFSKNISVVFLSIGVDECGVIRYIYLCCFSELPSFDFQQFS